MRDKPFRCHQGAAAEVSYKALEYITEELTDRRQCTDKEEMYTFIYWPVFRSPV